MSVPDTVLKHCDDVRNNCARHNILSSGIKAKERKNEILKLIDYLEENTFCMRGDQKRIERARARLSHLVSGI